jgi:hypothetical protein
MGSHCRLKNLRTVVRTRRACVAVARGCLLLVASNRGNCCGGEVLASLPTRFLPILDSFGGLLEAFSVASRVCVTL